MIVRSINITREGDYGYGTVDQTKPFRAKVSVHGVHGAVELLLPEDLSRQVVSLIAEQIAAAGRATAEAMVAEAFNAAALPAPEAS